MHEPPRGMTTRLGRFIRRKLVTLPARTTHQHPTCGHWCVCYLNAEAVATEDCQKCKRSYRNEFL